MRACLLWPLLTAVLLLPSVDAQAATPFNFEWLGTPATPLAWTPQSINDWDLLRGATDPMQAQHGPDCAAPPAMHPISAPQEQIFICNNHLMTASSAGYNAIYFAPAQMVDFSSGTQSVSWNVSTEHLNGRVWWDVWLTPFENNLAGPLQSWLDVAFQGPPKEALHFMLNGDGTFRGELYHNFTLTDITTLFWPPLDQLLTTSEVTRSKFEIDVSSTHVRFGLPNYDGAGSNQWYVDSNVSLPFTQAVVQIGHHTYNPGKDCNPDGGVPAPNMCPTDTFHWSSFNISNAVPFTMLRGNPYMFSALTTVIFPRLAPQGAFLRFQDMGVTYVSYNGGSTWQAAVQAATQPATVHPEHGHSYWSPVPAGVTSVMFRGDPDIYGDPWMVEDPAIWSRN